MPKLNKINPDDLTGPRSYFTDIDPKDKYFNEIEAMRKLKLQVLTKKHIIIAASSLFHDIGYELFHTDIGLSRCLEDGVIIPAIRNQFSDVEDFFQSRQNYSHSSRDYFLEHVSFSIPWDLKTNTSWFKYNFYKALNTETSVLRTKGGISKNDASDIKLHLEDIQKNLPEGNRFLQREHIDIAAKGYSNRTVSFLQNYANLIYRLSGAQVVHSEGHFPQSNLTKLELVGNDRVLSDESIFWDIFAETVFSHLGSAIRVDADRLDRLTFSDLLNIRKEFFSSTFSNDYDNLICSVKNKIDINDPQRLILHTSEIAEMATVLRNAFSERIAKEIDIKDTSVKENSLWQLANVLFFVPDPSFGLIFGALSTLKAIPQITSLISNNLSTELNNRYEWIRMFVNSKLGWSKSQKKSFLDAYNSLVTYGLKK